MLKDLRTGIYTVIVLEIIERESPIHGYAILSKIREYSDGVLDPSESTVYETLKYLEKNKLIKSFWGESTRGLPRKYYVLTDKGKTLLDMLRKELKTIISVLNKILYENRGHKNRGLGEWTP